MKFKLKQRKKRMKYQKFKSIMSTKTKIIEISWNM